MCHFLITPSEMESPMPGTCTTLPAPVSAGDWFNKGARECEQKQKESKQKISHQRQRKQVEEGIERKEEQLLLCCKERKENAKKA